MKRLLFTSFVELTGSAPLSRLLRSFTCSPLSRPLIRPFQQLYDIRQDDMIQPISSYTTLNDFFTRSIDQTKRPFDSSDNVLIAPTDADVTVAERLQDATTFTIKGQTYTIDRMLGSKARAMPYENGEVYVFYLSPQHYHHFHYPIDGTIINRYALGNVSYPVNTLGLTYGNEPFHTNYRLITEIEHQHGRIAIVKVGALNVNSVQLYRAEERADKGRDFGYFSFGSTVVLFVSPSSTFQRTVESPQPIQMGETIGRWETT